MRLRSVSERLANQFASTNEMSAACKLFEGIYSECVARLSQNIFDRVQDSQLRSALVTGNFTDFADLASSAQELDEAYLLADEQHTIVDAGELFSLARLASALAFASHAQATSDYSEAAYEAIMALPELDLFLSERGL